MSDRLTPILDQIDKCIAQARGVRQGRNPGGIASSADVHAALMRCAAAIGRFAPVGSPYDTRAKAVKNGPTPLAMMMEMTGILQGLRDDYAAGYLQTVEELIHADVFADFLQMADELQKKGFKDPAAVLAGSVLEEHLRKLGAASGLKIESGGKPKTANAINADLTKAGVYNNLVQKQIGAWQDLRNSAAHGNYDEYDHGQVAGLIRDVRDFMVRHPA